MFTLQVFQDIPLDLWPHQSLSRSHLGGGRGERSKWVKGSSSPKPPRDPCSGLRRTVDLTLPQYPQTLTFFFISGAKGVQLRQRRYS